MLIHDTNVLMDDNTRKTLNTTLKKYDKIIISKKASGSLQSKHIFEGDLFEKKSDLGFHSIIKFSSAKSVRNDKAGHKLLNKMFDTLGEYLVPYSDYYPIPTTGSNRSKEYCVIIPKITGINMAEYVTHIDKNVYAKQRHKEIFTHIYRISDFMNKISVQEDSKINTGQMIYDHLFNPRIMGAKKRHNKILFLLKAMQLPENSRFISMEGSKIINPLNYFLNYPDFSLTNPAHDTIYLRYSHGDLHLGNIYINQRGKITILDYDYVGIRPKDYDRATFEASMFLKLIERFNNICDWNTHVKPIIKDYYQLNKINSNYKHLSRIVKILTAIKSFERDSYSYKACLLIAYSRLLTSYVKVDMIKTNPGIATTCIMMIGKLLKDIYSESVSTLSIKYSFFK